MEEKNDIKNYMPMVAVLLCGALLVVLNATLLSPTLPTIMVQFDVSATTVQWLTSAYTLMEAVVIPLSAYLLGRFSTRKLFFTGIGLFTVFSLVAAFAPNFPVLLVARALQALGGGIVMPMTITLVMLIFPREKRGMAMGLVTLVISFAPAIGPTAGGLLVDFVGWRALFGVVCVLGAVVLVLGVKFVKNYGEFESYPLDVPSVALMMCGMIALLYGISTVTSASNVVIPIVLMVVGLALLALFVRRQLTLEQPMLNLTTLKSAKFRTDVVAIMVLQAAMIGGTVLLPLYVQNVLGYSATVSGLIILPGALLGAGMALVAGRLFDRHGVRGVACAGVTLFALAGVGTTFYAIDSSILFVCLVFTCFSFAAQMITTPLNTWGVNSLDNRLIQHANSLSNSLNQVAGSIGTALLTSLTALGASIAPNASALEQTYAGDHVAFYGLCALSVVCAFIVWVFARDKKAAPATEAERAAVATAAAGAAVPAYVGGYETGRSWTVAEAMDRNPKFVYDNQKVGDAFALFVNTETDGVPVITTDRRVVGYLSDGDVLDYFAEKDMGFSGMAANLYRFVDDERIQDTMGTLLELDAMTLATHKAITLDAGMSLERACAVFTERRLKKAPVVQDGKLVGSLSRRNIMSFIAAKTQGEAEVAPQA